jgi:hypothetical protein
MVNTCGGYGESGEAFLQGLERIRRPKMMGSSHEEHDKEDLEATFTRLEQSIAALTEMVTQLLVIKDKEGHLTET